uniref:Uncharacterized protein n=1 Tax=Anguilla anguilla TaxID=7936 RepID=A0A0E9QSD0_ANGAN
MLDSYTEKITQHAQFSHAYYCTV